MSLAVFVTPKLVRISDPNSNPMDVWMVEFPFWLAKYLCDQKAHNENGQQLNAICQAAPPTFHIPCAFTGLFKWFCLNGFVLSVLFMVY